MQLGDENMSITIFDQQPVRRAWHDGRWFYSVIDVIAVLAQNDSPRRYWSDLKRKLKSQGFTQVYADIVHLKLLAPDGKLYATDCADTETMLRIIQSIPSPKAEPFKQWLASLGAEIIEDDRTEDRRRLDYRQPKAEAHQGLHAEIHQRGVRRPEEHAEFDVRGQRFIMMAKHPAKPRKSAAFLPVKGRVGWVVKKWVTPSFEMFSRAPILREWIFKAKSR